MHDYAPHLRDAEATTDPIKTYLDHARIARKLDATLRYGGKGSRESNALHSFMLSDVASAIAEELYPDLEKLPIRQMSNVHEVPENITGDMITLGLTSEELAAKATRDAAAVKAILDSPDTPEQTKRALMMYEAQDTPEARLVKAVDKLMPMISRIEVSSWLSLYDGAGVKNAATLREKQAISRQTFRDRFGAEFPELVEIFIELQQREYAMFAQWLNDIHIGGTYDI